MILTLIKMSMYTDIQITVLKKKADTNEIKLIKEVIQYLQHKEKRNIKQLNTALIFLD